ncbi:MULTISPECIES: heme exporter protein CcmD [unclassified Brevundimonas]|uniref:heme exporter protein CcmD n=1 Tax=unclassified Brevundimonas TaxID=2622653 RepID=UPI0025C5A155|nr:MULTISPECIES: heme exporter protein CcmD [unclassified Brevundimonas]
MLDLDMTPYAAFVWPAWEISALVLTALTVRAVMAARKWKRELDRMDTAAGEAARPQVARSAIGPKETGLRP